MFEKLALFTIGWFLLSLVGLWMCYAFERKWLCSPAVSFGQFLRRTWYSGVVNLFFDGDDSGSDAGNLFMILGGPLTFIFGLVMGGISLLRSESSES